MIYVKGVNHLTLGDAAQRLSVSPRTVNEYIKRGVLTTPPRVKQGLRTFYVFSEEYLREAERTLAVLAGKKR